MVPAIYSQNKYTLINRPRIICIVCKSGGSLMKFDFLNSVCVILKAKSLSSVLSLIFSTRLMPEKIFYDISNHLSNWFLPYKIFSIVKFSLWSHLNTTLTCKGEKKLAKCYSCQNPLNAVCERPLWYKIFQSKSFTTALFKRGLGRAFFFLINITKEIQFRYDDIFHFEWKESSFYKATSSFLKSYFMKEGKYRTFSCSHIPDTYEILSSFCLPFCWRNIHINENLFMEIKIVFSQPKSCWYWVHFHYYDNFKIPQNSPRGQIKEKLGKKREMKIMLQNK